MGERVKTVVVTGASSGFGLLTAVELAKRGFSVIATMRNLDNRDTIIRLCKLHHVEKQLTCLQLDVTDAESIENFKANLADFTFD